jgi:hypothetical protein
MHVAPLSPHKYDLVLSQDQPPSAAWNLADMSEELSVTTGGI